jgi:hypothetical protein
VTPVAKWAIASRKANPSTVASDMCPVPGCCPALS